MKRDGWERASILFWTRPNRLPVYTTPTDFLVPSGRLTFGMLWRCGVIAFCGSIFYVLLPLALLLMWIPVDGRGDWVWVAGAVAFPVGWLGLLWAAVREDVAIREWLEDQ